MPGGIHPPLEVKLSWPKPNYENPTLRPDTVLWLSCILGPVTVGLLLVRLWVRIFHQRSPGWDDWLMLAATIPTIALTVIYPLATKEAFDRHIWDLDYFTDPQIIVRARKYVLASECIFCVATGLIKVSILLFYRRLSARVVSRAFLWTTRISIGYIIAYSIALSIAPIVGCQPISAFWDQVDIIKMLEGYEYHCFDEAADVFAASIISASQDLITAFLPTFLYWNLQIPFRQKLALFGIFAIGYGVVVLGALRAYYSWQTFYGTYDVTWATWNMFVTCLLELHIGCLCANAPALKFFFKHFFQEKLSSRSRTKTPVGSDDRKDSGHGKSSFWGMLTSTLSNGSQTRSTKGYHDSHIGLSVDHQGGVHIQREIHVHRSPTSTLPETSGDRPMSSTTTDNIVDHYYDDIEMGRFTTSNSRASSMRSPKAFEVGDLEALPPLPMSPASPTSPTDGGSVKCHPQSPMPNKLPIPPFPIAATTGQGANKRSLSPFPPQNPTHNRPSWQSWS
ncbi:integral membrane protein [Stemphylium lycopersici]|uniref:Integral membrane protein n=1 Tax=Stemphylium lycopersici TaxID=183478 RepID=A0A364N901_STELY|nr:integral membrane protein [Stemphylium lycopersici]RAR13785.1 integral membrane protein [Stemphylium lycopersici]